jgi:hypothetical protein
VVRLTFKNGLEETVSRLIRMPLKQYSFVVRLLDVLAAALDDAKPEKTSSKAHALRTSYVVEIAHIWRKVGLRPTRARSPFDPTYASRFHRFGELVLDGLADFSKGRSELRSMRSNVGPLTHPYMWHLSEDHIRAALIN